MKTFKKISALFATALIIMSCNTIEEMTSEHVCPIVPEESVPIEITSQFQTEEEGTIVTWFLKDDLGYCAVYSELGKEHQKLYDLNGDIIAEHAEDEKDDDKLFEKDNEPKEFETGCECEVDDND